ncbi:hypothetical protein PISMIDRAFT_19258 [Pisolithus microcarpus 441]|uniref:Uncharacterized protein n=1 Tax=Pisolithus microcarpus 441 TaxID=765257 RepID=A0A0C9XHE3_9AGAM|nr:hypothetical protein PISMIDRAFT_19258 [Pisolithus microcarpus 441]
MVFGIFTRKPPIPSSVSPEQPTGNANSAEPRPVSRLPTPTPSTVSIPASARQSPLRFPTSLRAVFAGNTGELVLGDSDHDMGTANGGESPAAQPPMTPSPPPPPPVAGDSQALYDLMLTIPPKTLHAYTLTHLRPLSPEPSSSRLYNNITPGTGPITSPPSPETVSKLHKFFATLAPPPLLHCVRCHADFYDIENEEKDKACRVPHDDESALVSRVTGGGYETLWGCCGKTVEGDGGEGPPDGWCYEGRHTGDTKRARFRADSTIHDDKLTSCLKLNCRGIRDTTLPRAGELHSSSPTRKSNVSPARSHAVASVTRKRLRKSINKDTSSASEDERDRASNRGRDRNKDKSHQKGEDVNDSGMIIDDPPPKAKAKPVSRGRVPNSTSTTASLPPLPSKPIIPTSNKPLKSTQKPKSTSSRTLLSQSHNNKQEASDSDTSSRVRPRTRSLVRERSEKKDSSTRLRRSAREPSRSFRLREAMQGAEGEGDGCRSTDNRGDDREEEGTRGRKKRRTGV